MNENKSIKQSLDKFSENLDKETLNQLDRIRINALATMHKPIKIQWYQNFSWPILGPAMAAMLLFVVLIVSNQSQFIEPKTETFFDDLDVLTYEIDSELLEDLEFVAWLDQQNILEGELL